ncbi:glycosyltransferase family 2 protein [Acuticoccus sediminis]|nr:glycosyltransferase family A protein [Acuticoccus sediminis]
MRSLMPQSPYGPVRHRRISVIICTRNRADALAQAFAALRAAADQRRERDIEVVVVDNGSIDETPAVIARFADAAPFRVVTVTEPRQGLARARNAALQLASGDLLVFVDDDCELHPDFFRRLRRHYANDREPVVRGGRVELADERDMPVTLKLSGKVERLDRKTPPGGFIHGCNMTIPREVVHDIGAFDERFGAGARFRSAEDTDYLVRSFLHGVPVEYVPDVVVRHRHGRRTREAAIEAVVAYAFGNGALYTKHLRRAPFLMNHVRWTLFGSVREVGGGAPFDRALRIPNRRIAVANVRGIAAFVRASMAGGDLDSGPRVLGGPWRRRLKRAWASGTASVNESRAAGEASLRRRAWRELVGPREA